MALHVAVEITVRTPDGTAQVIVAQTDLTINPHVGDFEMEAGLAKVSVNQLTERVRDEAFSKLDGWVAAMQEFQRLQKEQE